MISILLAVLAISGLPEWEDHLLDMDIAAAEMEIQAALAEDSLNIDAQMAGLITRLVDTGELSVETADSLSAHLTILIENDTSSIYILTALGYIEAYRNTLPERVTALFEQAFTVDHGFVFARLGYGSALALSGYEEKGFDIIDFDLRLSTSLLAAYFKIAYFRDQKNRNEELLEAYRIAVFNYPDDVSLFAGYITELYSSGRKDEAESVFCEHTYTDLQDEYACHLLANIYRENECWQGAIECYEYLLGENPDNENYYIEIGYCLEMMDNPDTAREMYIEALRVNPESAVTNYYLGMLEVTASDMRAATDYVIRAAECDPLYIYDVFDLALTFENEEDMESAVYLFQEALKVDTLVSYAEEQLDLNVNILLAYDLEYLDRYEEAIDIYSMVIREDSSQASVWRSIGSAYETLDEDDMAVETYLEAVNNIALDETPWFYGQLGYLMEDENDTDAALAYYTEAVKIDSLYTYGWRRIGAVTVQTGEYQTALEALERAFETGSDSLSCMAGRILALEGLGRDTEAAELEESFLNLYPTGWIEYVYFTFLSGESLALAIAERVREDAEDRVLLFSELAYLYDYLGVPFEADSCFIAAIDADRTNTKTLDDYAQYLINGGRDEDAIEFLLMISAIDNLDFENWNVLGERLLFSERLDEAENAFLTSLSIEPGQVWVLAYLGYLYELREDLDTALDYYYATLEVSPGYDYVEGRITSITNPNYTTPSNSDTSGNLHAQVRFYSNVEIGDTREKNYNIGCNIEYDFDERGSNLELNVDYALVESTREWVDDTNWTNISLSSARHITGDISVVLGSEWDRRPGTVRPWQITSSLSGAYGKWMTDWFFMYPEIGIGLVNTHWEKWTGLGYEDERTHILTTFGSLFLQISNYEKKWPVFMLYGDFYIPPDDTDRLITHSIAEISFSLWDPLSFSIGYTLDYTRTPVYEHWKKYDSNFYARFNLGIF